MGAQQLERGNKVAPIATLAPTTSTTTSTTTTTTTTTTELRTTLIATLPLMTERIEVSEMSGRLITQIVSGSVLIMLEILMIVAYVILINHNKIDYRKRMTFVLILICTPFIETVIYFMIFYDTFDTALGGVLLVVMLLMLGGFSACINLLITKECSSSKLAPLVSPNDTIDMEYTEMHPSDVDSSLKDTTITSVVTLGAVNTSVQSAPVNIDELKRKKLQERRSSKTMDLGPRLTSSPKPKPPPNRCPSPSAKSTTSKSLLNRSINRSLNRSITVSPMLQKCYDRINTSLERKNKEELKSPKNKKLPPIKGKQRSQTEEERLKSKWNEKYDREINQTIESLEVKTEKVKSSKTK